MWQHFLYKKHIRHRAQNTHRSRFDFAPPALYKIAHRADMRIDPKCCNHSLAQQMTTLTRAVVTLIKPEFYIRRRVAKSEALCEACTVAYTIGKYAMYCCYAVNVRNLGMCRHKEPHRQIFRQPLRSIFRFFGGKINN